MKYPKNLLLPFCFLVQLAVSAQSEDYSKQASLTIFSGLINYQGDLNPNSFTIGHSNFALGVSIRKPLSRRLIARAGFNIGQVEAADRYNRDYLKPRNLSFFSSIQEAYAAIEINFLDIEKSRLTPYLYGGIAVFHFNPWTYDNSGRKVFLKPLSTEGQGIATFPSQKPYKLTQFCLPFGAGIKYAASDNINISLEFSQRKTFTDYLDDVSSFYVDRHTLQEARGSLAVELAFRGDEVPGGPGYPGHGEQRGTATEMDWYYFTGIGIEIKMNAIASLLHGAGGRNRNYQQRCPRPVF